jgi:uncharacterized beta-barrel protein YwiB (DUF1934 family)
LKKNVSISLVSTQFDGDRSEKIEMMTEGELMLHKDGYDLSYQDSEASGLVGSTTMLKVREKRVELQRTGGIHSDLILELGKKHHCHYGTEFGDFMVGVMAKNIKSNITEDGGSLDFCYVIDINSSFIGNFEININVTPIS